MLGMASNGGAVCPVSQFRTVRGLTPSRSAACFRVNLGSSRRFLGCGAKEGCAGVAERHVAEALRYRGAAPGKP